MSKKQYLEITPERTGRLLAEDGHVFNEADYHRSDGRAINEGLWPGARILRGFGERISSGTETAHPIWANGPTVRIGPEHEGEAVYLQSTSPEDAELTGTGVRKVEIHYIRSDLSEGKQYVAMKGVTPVKVEVDDILFVQELHVADYGSVGAAVGTITAKNQAGDIYEQIAPGRVRGTSSFRMVPAGFYLLPDLVVLSSASGTADTRSTFHFVATALGGHPYLDPPIYMPHMSVGLQNSAQPIPLSEIVEPFRSGTVVGVQHTSDKGATLSATWAGRLVPVEGVSYG